MKLGVLIVCAGFILGGCSQKDEGQAPGVGGKADEWGLDAENNIGVLFNQPECACTAGEASCAACQDLSGGIRPGIISLLAKATTSIDLSIYGLDDPPILEALCQAARRGVRVRVVGDDDSEGSCTKNKEEKTEELPLCSSRSYYPSFAQLRECGAQVEHVVSAGIMHNKFYLIDAALPERWIITGSANQTTFCIEKNHNHMLFFRQPHEGLVAAYQAEFDQLLTHCQGNTDRSGNPCTECSPVCMTDRSEHGPWQLIDQLGKNEAEISLYFAPVTKSRPQDPLDVLRGMATEKSVDTPDPTCQGDDATCVCQQSGSRFKCAYCAQDERGWGLLGEAKRRVLATVYALTDPCFALGQARAARQGLETNMIINLVEAAQPYTRDDYLCAAGVPVYLSNWGPIPAECSNPLPDEEWQRKCAAESGDPDPICASSVSQSVWDKKCIGSAIIRNHNKVILVDDVIFDGSMNITASGTDKNNENSLVIRSKSLAGKFAQYIRGEVELLERRGVRKMEPASCLCKDLVDNDGDGLFDGDDPDCDQGK